MLEDTLILSEKVKIWLNLILTPPKQETIEPNPNQATLLSNLLLFDNWNKIPRWKLSAQGFAQLKNLFGHLIFAFILLIHLFNLHSSWNFKLIEFRKLFSKFCNNHKIRLRCIWDTLWRNCMMHGSYTNNGK